MAVNSGETDRDVGRSQTILVLEIQTAEPSSENFLIFLVSSTGTQL